VVAIPHVGPHLATLFTPHPAATMSDQPGYHNRNRCIGQKINSLLISLTKAPSKYDEITPKIEYWIEYVLREDFSTVDELVERVSYVAWEQGGLLQVLGSSSRSSAMRPSALKRQELSSPGCALTCFGGSQ
jgi:hypothetical protein